jgi:uncharacterized membrane protein
MLCFSSRRSSTPPGLYSILTPVRDMVHGRIKAHYCRTHSASLHIENRGLLRHVLWKLLPWHGCVLGGGGYAALDVPGLRQKLYMIIGVAVVFSIEHSTHHYLYNERIVSYNLVLLQAMTPTAIILSTYLSLALSHQSLDRRQTCGTDSGYFESCGGCVCVHRIA